MDLHILKILRWFTKWSW